jgi:hypothetical protein
MVRRENEKLISRLENFKFTQAQNYLEGENEMVVDVVNALASVFGNVGWMDGDMGTILSSAVYNIIPIKE